MPTRHVALLTLTLALSLTIAACGGGSECRLNADCDDADACTVDSCSAGTCVREPLACDDGLFCNGAETCDSAIGCQDGAAPDVEDEFECTIDYCDEATDTIRHEPNDPRCDDDQFCNGIEVCVAGVGCVVGTETVIDDGIACTEDVCDEASDLIAHYPVDARCDDGQFCNGVETCDATLDCLAGTPPVLDDGVACTDDYCDDVFNEVVNMPNDSNCDDAVFCNGAEVCDAFAGCLPGVSPVDDMVACTDDVCDERNDVVIHTPNNGSCNDGYGCTADSCDPSADCQNVADGTCACTNVLLYSDCTVGPCTTVVDSSAADDAAEAFGLSYVETTDMSGDFESQLATGNFDLVIIESNLGCLPTTMQSALGDYINSGGRVIFAHWDLDGSNGSCPDIAGLRTALGVTTGPDVTTARDIHAAPLAPVDMFDSLRTLPSPLVITDLLADDGDELTVIDGADFVAARFDSDTGPGAIAVTRARQVVVNGFDPFGAIIGVAVDADDDGVRDMEELYVNEIALLCGI